MKFSDISNERTMLDEDPVPWYKRAKTMAKAAIPYFDIGKEGRGENNAEYVTNVIWAELKKWMAANKYGRDDQVPAEELRRFLAGFGFGKSADDVIQDFIRKKQAQTSESIIREQDEVSFNLDEIKQLIRRVAGTAYGRDPEVAVQYAKDIADLSSLPPVTPSGQGTQAAPTMSAEEVKKIQKAAVEQAKKELLDDLLERLNVEFYDEFNRTDDQKAHNVRNIAYDMFRNMARRVSGKILQEVPRQQAQQDMFKSE